MAQTQLLRAVSARASFLAAIAAAAGGLTGIITPLGAQNRADMDLASIRARAAAQQADADVFARTIARRGKEFSEDARNVAAAARRNLDGAKSAAPSASRDRFDFDEMIAAASAGARTDRAPRLIAFASLSMPADALRRMVADVGAAGGSVVFRGLPANSARGFTAALAKVLPEGPVTAGIGIDPRLFRAFGVDAVPAYVVTSGAVDLCDGFDCRSSVPPHDMLRGNVTLEYALQTVAAGGGPGASAATAFARRLEAAR